MPGMAVKVSATAVTSSCRAVFMANANSVWAPTQQDWLAPIAIQGGGTGAGKGRWRRGGVASSGGGSGVGAWQLAFDLGLPRQGFQTGLCRRSGGRYILLRTRPA